MSKTSITMGIGWGTSPDEDGQPPQVPVAPIILNTDAGTLEVILESQTSTFTVVTPAQFAGAYPVIIADLAAGPVNLVPPRQLVPSVTEGADLNARSGLWLFDADHPTLSHQWQRNGLDIPGATGLSYTTQGADVGAEITVLETAVQPETGSRVQVSDTAAVTADLAGKTIVFSLIGQSNMVGWDTFDSGAGYPAEVYQVARSGKTSGGTDGQVVPAGHLLDHHDGAASFMGPALQFAIDYKAAHPADTVILVPDAKGSTAFAGNHWNPGNSYYTTAVARVNALLAANPAYEFGGFLWHQGESDAGNATDAANYQARLEAMIAQLRVDVTGADATTPFVLGGMVPSWVVGDPNRQTVQTALETTPGRVAHTAYVDPAGLTPRVDGIHFNAASLRTLGAGYHAALSAAEANNLSWQISDTTIQSFPTVQTPGVAGTVVTAGA